MKILLEHNGWQAAIDSLGAELNSWKDPSGKEYLWTSDPAYWSGSSPLLFPIISNVRGDRIRIEGKEYEMPKHGFAMHQEFTAHVIQPEKAVFSLRETPATRLCFPFDFLLELIYELKDHTLSMTSRVTNRDARPLPYHLGAHPGFLCPMEEGELFSDYVIEFEKEERLESLEYDAANACFDMTKKVCHGAPGRILSLTHEKFDRDALLFYHTNSRTASLKHSVTNKGIRVEYPDFVSIAFWTPAAKQAPFLCFEPWNGASIFADEEDHLEQKRDIQILNAGESREYRLKLSVLS